MSISLATNASVSEKFKIGLKGGLYEEADGLTPHGDMLKDGEGSGEITTTASASLKLVGKFGLREAEVLKENFLKVGLGPKLSIGLASTEASHAWGTGSVCLELDATVEFKLSLDLPWWLGGEFVVVEKNAAQLGPFKLACFKWPDLVIETDSHLPDGIPGRPYAAKFEANRDGVKWSAPDGLPSGFTLDEATGKLSGTPATVGPLPFRVVATDEDDTFGDPTSKVFTLGVPILPSFTATNVVTAAYHTCAVVTGGTVKCWGGNFSGELGDGTTTPSSAPVDVVGVSGATQLSAGGEGGSDFTCALVGGGHVKCWGEGQAGELGNGTTVSSATPVDVAGVAGATQISSGRGFTSRAHHRRNGEVLGLQRPSRVGERVD